MDTYIGNQSGCFGAGELANLFDDTLQHRSCSCGLSLDECPIWSIILSECCSKTVKELSRTSRILESLMSVTDHDSHKAIWGPVFERLFHEFDVVVDSSKFSRKTFHRLSYLRGLGYDIATIHIHKSPEELVRSIRAGSNKKQESGEANTQSKAFLLRSIVGWTISRITLFWYFRFKKFDIHDIRLNDFLAAPDSSLSSVLNRELSPSRTLQSGHGISGNRTRRRSENIYLKISEDGKTFESDLNMVERLTAAYMRFISNQILPIK
jgi:hypothetical protein